MKLNRPVAACVVLLAVAAGPVALADQLQPPPVPSSAADSEARWIRKSTPAAPMPVLPPAPLPPTDPGFELPEPSTPAPGAGPGAAGEQPALTPLAASADDPAPAPIQDEKPAPDPLADAAERLSSDAPGLTLAELEQLALANNPTLAQAAMRIEAARGKCVQAGLYPNPVIGYLGDEIGLEGSAGQQGMFVGQQIVTGGKLKLRRAVIGWEIEQGEHVFQAQRRRVLNDVRKAWYEVLVAQRVVELNEKLVQVGDQGVKAAEDLMAALEVGRADVLQFKIEADSARLELYNARNRHRAAWRRLAAVLGVPDVDSGVLAGDLEHELPELSWEESLARLLAESPELARARSGVELARCAVARENAEWIPNVDVQAGVRYHDAAHDTVASVEVGLPLPIFNRNQGNICTAQAELTAAEKEVQRIELALRRRLAPAFARYDSARNQARKYAADIRPNAESSLDLVQEGLKEGEFDYLTLLTAQRTYFRVNLAYLEALLELHTSSVAIEGLLLGGSLEVAADDEG